MKIERTPSLLAIIDDDKSVQGAVQDLIESAGMSTLCFDSAKQFLDSGTTPDVGCAIADIRMPGMSGIEMQLQLKADNCRIPIIFMTGIGDIPLAVSAMKHGAVDFFTKPVEEGALLAAVARALERDRNDRLKALEQADLIARHRSLSPREQEVLPLLVGGLLNKQAAAELGITEYTVQIHRGHIMRKMKVDSFAALVKIAEKLDSYRP
jgi:FixJ family two-component response regulator